MRLFIALEPTQSFVDQTEQLARTLAANMEGRFMKPETHHVTLAFLGEGGEEEAAGAMAALDAVAGAPAIPLAPDGLGAFSKKRERTLYLALKREDALMKLADSVRTGLDARDVKFDRKKFLPHITLARRARIPQGSLPELPFPEPADATRVTLFKSTLTPEGAVYKPLYSVELEG